MKLQENEIRPEKWFSSEGRTEIHFFRKEDDEYLFGYNPLLFPDMTPEKFYRDILKG